MQSIININTKEIVNIRTNKWQNDCLEKTGVNRGVDVVVVAHLAGKVTEQIDRPQKQVATHSTKAVTGELVGMTTDELQVPLVSPAELVYVV